MRISPVFLIALGVSVILGLVGGSAFGWAGSQRAWDIFTAAFLWTLISAAGTTIGRFFGERVRRGAWRHGLWIAGAQSFPLATMFLLAASAGSGFALPSLVLSTAPVLYGSSLAVATLVGVIGVITSPFTR